MEIFIKKHENLIKVKWLNSMPLLYKKEILSEFVKRDVELDVNEEYRIVVDILSGMESKKPQGPIFDPRGT